MSDHFRNSDLIANSTAESVGRSLDLKYEHVMSPFKSLKIVISAVSLLTVISLSQHITGFFDVVLMMAALGVFARICVGSPMERRLTAESMERLQTWLASEDTKSKESSHVGDPE